MPEKAVHSNKKRHHRSRDRSRSPFSEESSRHKDKRPRRHVPDVTELAPVDDNSESFRGSGDVSLSISETNALRAKLGLAPLELDDGTPKDSNRPTENQLDNYVHAPAKDLKKIRETEVLKEKIAVHKDKRSMYEKLANARLYEPEEKDTSVSSWVDKIREKERIKRQAQERAKLLSEMDDQLENVDEESFPIHMPSAASAYEPSHLVGLKVEHKSDVFQEGKSVILTLKDKGVLEDDDDTDVLVNVNIVDDEKAQLNRENLRKMAGIAGIGDEEEEDVLLGLRHKNILSKYDVEIEGNRKSHFTIGPDGTYLPHTERLMEQLQTELRAGKQTLPDTELRVASEYYSSEELQAKFKKRVRRVKKSHARTALTADDLLDTTATLGETSSAADLGSRASRREHAPKSEQSEKELGEIDMPTEEPTNNSYDSNTINYASDALVEDDELRGEIEKTIGRVIKSKSAVYVKQEEVVAESLTFKQEEPKSVPAPTPTSATVVFDATAEFYKSIGTGLQETMRQHSRLIQMKQEYDDQDANDEASHTQNSPLSPCDWGMRKKEPSPDRSSVSDESDSEPWQSVTNNQTDGRRSQHKNNASFPGTAAEAKSLKSSKLAGVLDDEPVLDTGVFSALKLAEKKGYLDKGKEKRTGAGTMVNLMAKHFVQEDVRYDDIDAKFARRDRYSGPLSEFKELKQYKPDVKLEYVDELGRQLNAKEAFRQLSHKFHGKGSGKNKTEKRMKKIKEEFLLKASTSSDTPLGTAEKLNKKLKSISQPFVILSGKNAAVKNLTK